MRKKLVAYIQKNSTRYKSLLRSKERVESSCRPYRNVIEHIVSVRQFDYAGNSTINRIAKELLLSNRNEVLIAIDATKYNNRLYKEFVAVVDADYSEYSEYEYEEFLRYGEMSFEDYYSAEKVLCKQITVDIKTGFEFVVTLSIINSNNQEVRQEVKRYDESEVLKLLETNEVKIDKEVEKRLVKERLVMDGRKCYICGSVSSKENRVGVHYVVPLEDGGELSILNMRSVCVSCIKSGKVSNK